MRRKIDPASRGVSSRLILNEAFYQVFVLTLGFSTRETISIDANTIEYEPSAQWTETTRMSEITREQSQEPQTASAIENMPGTDNEAAISVGFLKDAGDTSVQLPPQVSQSEALMSAEIDSDVAEYELIEVTTDSRQEEVPIPPVGLSDNAKDVSVQVSSGVTQDETPMSPADPFENAENTSIKVITEPTQEIT